MEILKNIREISNEFSKVNKVLEKEILEKTKKVELLRSEIKRGVESCRTELNKSNDLRKEFKELISKKELLLSEISSLEKEKDKIRKNKEDIKESENKKKSLENKVTELNNSMTILNNKQNMSEVELKKLDENITSKTIEKNKIIDVINSMNKELSSVKLTRVDLENNNDRLLKELEELKERKVTELSELEILNMNKKEIEKINQDLSKKTRDLSDKLDSENRKLIEEQGKVKIEMEKIDIEKSKLNQDNERLNAVRKELSQLIMDHREVTEAKKLAEFIKSIEK